MIETKRFYLRPWQIEDAPILYEICKDPKIGPICGWSPHTSIEYSCFVLKNILMNDDTYAILLKENNTIIGNISLMPMKHSNFARNEKEGEIGFWLHTKYWNQGYMSEIVNALLSFAFQEKGLHLIWAGYFEENLASKRVQEKNGFTYAYTIHDLYVDALHKKTNLYVNKITIEEWRNHHD